MATLTVGTNSYITVADADAYLDQSPRATDWAFLGAQDKIRALIGAYRRLEREDWAGSKTNSAPTQTQAFPRTGLVNKEGETLDSGTVPQFIKDAQAEYAFELSQDPDLEAQANTGSNEKRLRAGSAEIEFFQPTIGSAQSTTFPTAVQEIIGCFLESGATSGGTIGGVFTSGTDGVTSFTNPCDPGLTEGLA